MRNQKKEPNPAKGAALIGNRCLNGILNLANLRAINNANRRQIFGEMIPTSKNGYNTMLKFCKALESKFKGVLHGSE